MPHLSHNSLIFLSHNSLMIFSHGSLVRCRRRAPRSRHLKRHDPCPPALDLPRQLTPLPRPLPKLARCLSRHLPSCNSFPPLSGSLSWHSNCLCWCVLCFVFCHIVLSSCFAFLCCLVLLRQCVDFPTDLSTPPTPSQIAQLLVPYRAAITNKALILELAKVLDS